MAENKKSFLLYSDVHHTVKKLSDDQAGKLFKHILSYVNDENPVTNDVIIDLVFEPIKQSLKRDLRRYEEIIEKRSLAGKVGGVESGESRRKKKEAKEANALKRKQTKQRQANEAVSDNDNDNVKEEKKYKSIPPSLEEIDFRIKERLITSFTAETFFAHYNSNGWMVGKNKMKDWDSTLTTWNSKKFNNNGNTGKSNQRVGERTNDYWN